jgi:regulator of sigma E protease
MMSLLQTLLAFVVALGVLVFVHELGHYLVARWFGVKVLRFSIGFGKPLLSWTVGADREQWSISAIPLGGYVKMLDEREARDEPIPAAELPRAFTQQSLGRRSLIVVAGPVANFLLAIALYALLGFVGTQEPAAVLGTAPQGTAAHRAGVVAGDRVLKIDGLSVISWNDARLKLLEAVVDRRDARLDLERDGQTVSVQLATAGLPEGEVEKDFLRTLGLELRMGPIQVSQTIEGEPAQIAGLRAGDIVTHVQGEPVTRSSTLIQLIRDNPGRPLEIKLQRGEITTTVVVTPSARASDRPDEQGKEVGRIGAGLSNKVELQEVRYEGLAALARGVEQTWDMAIFSLRMLGKMVTGQLSWTNLSGPVAIADYAGQSARIGWMSYVAFLALISISLGVLNLLPIPVLDGGHLVYYALEALHGRPLPEAFVEWTQRLGLGLIGAMMVVALFNDITRLIGST